MPYTIYTRNRELGVSHTITFRRLTTNERHLLISLFDDLNDVTQNEDGATQLFLFEADHDADHENATPLNPTHW